MIHTVLVMHTLDIAIFLFLKFAVFKVQCFLFNVYYVCKRSRECRQERLLCQRRSEYVLKHWGPRRSCTLLMKNCPLTYVCTPNPRDKI
jgi:hypothetical protein